jgi:ribokinase
MPAEHQVTVVGQIARDIVLQVDSIPAAGSAAPATQRLEMLGGKGANQALGLVQLGLRVSLLSAVGDDPAGEWLLGHAAADGIDTIWVARRPGAESGLIVSAVGPDGWRYVESLPAQVLVSPGDVALAEPAIRKADTMVIQLQQPGAAALAAAQAGRRPGGPRRRA